MNVSRSPPTTASRVANATSRMQADASLVPASKVSKAHCIHDMSVEAQHSITVYPASPHPAKVLSYAEVYNTRPAPAIAPSTATAAPTKLPDANSTRVAALPVWLVVPPDALDPPAEVDACEAEEPEPDEWAVAEDTAEETLERTEDALERAEDAAEPVAEEAAELALTVYLRVRLEGGVRWGGRGMEGVAVTYLRRTRRTGEPVRR